MRWPWGERGGEKPEEAVTLGGGGTLPPSSGVSAQSRAHRSGGLAPEPQERACLAWLFP